jgi:hypothetical protein
MNYILTPSLDYHTELMMWQANEENVMKLQT